MYWSLLLHTQSIKIYKNIYKKYPIAKDNEEEKKLTKPVCL